MADEATVSGSLTFTKEGRTVSLGKTGQQIDVTGHEYIRNLQTVGLSAEALLIGDIGTVGLCYFINHDATNFVEIRDGSGGADLIKIKAGEGQGPVRLATSTPYAIADTGSVKLEYLIIED